ncbi:MAG: carbon monoxide dehydrogenase [Actinophytocola sp.]|nr:carbon monoxide dehydrogenase [Actinophytocola sp.]
MRLEHEFSVSAPVEEVWQALLDPERVAPCLPGATLTGVDGDTFKAKVKVKLGPVTMNYQGAGEFVEQDADAHRLVIKASGKDTKGAGTASGTSTVTLTEADGGTHGAVVSELKVTGRPAQFGRGLIAEVSGRLLAEFAANLAGELAPEPAPEDTAATPVTDTGAAGEPSAEGARRPAEAIDLMDVAGAPVLKRVAPVVAVLAAILAVVVIVKATRKG